MSAISFCLFKYSSEIMKFFQKQSRLTRKKNLIGLAYVSPFIIGFFAMIFIPMIQSIIYSFNDLTFKNYNTTVISTYGKLTLNNVNFTDFNNSNGDMIISYNKKKVPVSTFILFF